MLSLLTVTNKISHSILLILAKNQSRSCRITDVKSFMTLDQGGLSEEGGFEGAHGQQAQRGRHHQLPDLGPML